MYVKLRQVYRTTLANQYCISLHLYKVYQIFMEKVYISRGIRIFCSHRWSAVGCGGPPVSVGVVNCIDYILLSLEKLYSPRKVTIL
jgi:hypothetical protein